MSITNYLPFEYPQYFYDYADSLYTTNKKDNYIVAVSPIRYPYQNNDTKYIYCAGQVKDRKINIRVAIHGEITEESAKTSVYNRLHELFELGNDYDIDYIVLDEPDMETKNLIISHMKLKEYLPYMYDRYFYDYAKEIYNDLGFFDYIVAVYPQGYPHQYVYEELFGGEKVIDAKFIYCAGNVRNRDINICLDIDGEVTEEKIVKAIKDRLHTDKYMLDYRIMDKPSQKTINYINKSLKKVRR